MLKDRYLVCLVCLVCLVFWLNERNQTSEINQIDQTNQMNQIDLVIGVAASGLSHDLAATGQPDLTAGYSRD